MNERGFTLSELLVAIAIIGLIMAGLLGLQQSGQTAYLTGAGRVEVQQNARIALDMMTRELRSAQAITAIGANCGTAGGDTTISFTDQNATAIVYSLTGTVLQRSSGGGAATDLIGGVQTLSIQCYNNSVPTPALTGTLANVRTIRISLTTQTQDSVASYSAESQHAVVTSQVRLRNLL